jgi:hypothetical protein
MTSFLLAWILNNLTLDAVTVVTFDDAAAVPAATESLIVSYVVPVGKTFDLTHVVGSSGYSTGTYAVYAAGVKKWQYDSTSAQRAVEWNLPTRGRYALPAGTLIELRVTHSELTSQDFTGTIVGTLR